MAMKPFKFSVLDLAPVKQGKSYKETFSDSLNLAQHAEMLGFERYWLAEHHNMKSIASAATSILIGYIANGTERIRVGSGGIMLPNHSSLVIAEQFGTLDGLYPNRIDLGLGRAPGTDQLTAQALGRNISTMNNSFPKQILELQHYFSKDNPGPVHAYPGQGANVPLYILGSSTDSAWLASEMGLPYAFAGHFAPEQMEIAFTIYRDNFKPSVHLAQPYILACVNESIGETDQEGEFLASTLYQAFVNIIRNDRKPYAPPVEDMDRIWSVQERALVLQKLKWTFLGSKQKVQNELAQFQDKFQVDEIIFNSHIFDHEARKKSYSLLKEVISDLF